MKTKLPKYIRSVSGAKKFLKALYNNGEGFSPCDDAHHLHPIKFTQDEGDKLNTLMKQICALPEVPNEFDPDGYIIDHLLPDELKYDYKTVIAQADVYLDTISIRNKPKFTFTTNIHTALEVTPMVQHLFEIVKSNEARLQHFKVKKIRITNDV